jgi:hypothetical protein
VDEQQTMAKTNGGSEHNFRFTSAARKAKALQRLGVSTDQLASKPQITPLLKDKRGSLQPALLAMTLSRDPVVQCFLAKRDSLGTWARNNTPWEAIALAAGIDLKELLGATVLAFGEFGKTIALSRYLEVMEKRIERAKLPGGWRDRDAIDKLLGLLLFNSSNVPSP